MNLKIKSLILAIIASISAAAEETTFKQRLSYLTPYVGAFDVNNKKTHTMLGIEYKYKAYNNSYIVPKLGGYLSSKSSAYGYVGFNIDFPMYKESLYLIPGFSVGRYFKGKGKDLGGALQFRSSIEIAYKMANSHRIGLSLSHISNASIYKKNPGAEDITINFSMPLGD